jgi:hypothetical protein
MDLSKLSDADLIALKSGDLSKVSIAGLEALRGRPMAPQPMQVDPSEGTGTLRVGPLDTGITTPQWLNRGLAGAGQALTNIGRGVGQSLGMLSREDIAEARRLDAPLSATTAGTVGNIAGNIAALAPTAMIPGANTVTGAGTIGALSGLLQPSTSTGETIANTALGLAGAAGGQAAANKIGSVARNAGSQITQGQQQAAAAGKAIGMRLTPGKASGSAALQKAEAALEASPLTSSGFDAIKEANQKALNRAAAKAIGETADELSTPVLSRAERRIGGVFQSVADKTPVPLDPVAVGGKLQAIRQESEGMLMGNADLDMNGLWRRLDSFVNDNGGASREQLRTLSSNLGKAARNNMTTPSGDRALGEALFSAQEVVEDAIQSTLTKTQLKDYAQARDQYRNLMSLTARSNVTNPSSGNVSGRNLASSLMTRDRGGFTMGKNTTDLYNAARFVQAFPDIVGNSGTATRSIGAADYLTGLPGGVLARLYLSQPVAAAAGAGGGAAATGAKVLDRELLRLLAQPVGTASGIGLANALQQ